MGEEKEAIIRTENLEHTYSSGDSMVLAIAGVNLVVRRGEFLAVIGHNGSGKSTLAKTFNALLLPTGGRVWVRGIDTADEGRRWEVRQTAGMVFQNPDNQIVATVVEEDVAFGPENLGVEPGEIRRRVDAALAAVGMMGYAHHAPHLLSGGQKQRVAIAGILAMRPEIIILDEPTSMLDPVGREEVLSVVRKLNREEGITVVYITHFMEEAVRADRVVVMEQGQVVLDGTPREVFRRVQLLKDLGLDVPPMTELAAQLRAAGVPIDEAILDVGEMAREIEKLLCP